MEGFLLNLRYFTARLLWVPWRPAASLRPVCYWSTIGRNVVLSINQLCHWAQCLVQLTFAFLFMKRLCRRRKWIDLHSGMGSASGCGQYFEEKSATDHFRHAYLQKWSVSYSQKKCVMLFLQWFLLANVLEQKQFWSPVNLIISDTPSAIPYVFLDLDKVL